MKKQIISILLLLILSALPAAISFAQSPISKGVYTVNGSLSYSSQTSDNSSDANDMFSFNPQLGYFFIDNFYTALSVNYYHISYGSVKSDVYGIGPAIRYYFDAEKLKPFLGLGFAYNEQTNNVPNSKTSSTEWKISGGADYFVTNNFALEASINYSFINYHYPNSLYVLDGMNSKLFQIGFGVNYFIY